MDHLPGTTLTQRSPEDLRSDIKFFAERLPYWGQMLADKILSGSSFDDNDIEAAYEILLEELDILPRTERGKISFTFGTPSKTHYAALKFNELRDVEGVNALAEKQLLKLHHNLTIFFGVNGSGKSGYVRLMKRVFYTKSREDILPNIHLERPGKKPAAVFAFSDGADKLELKFPGDEAHPAFAQFSVFDGKAVVNHIDHRNQLLFRPAGLAFFSEYADAVRELEAKLLEAITAKQATNYFPELFEGDSEIKELITGLSANTKLTELRKYLPFTEDEQKNKRLAEVEYDNMLIASRGKDQEIKRLQNIKQLLLQAKTSIEKLNAYLSAGALEKISKQIADFIEKEKIAKQEGREGFKTDLVQEVGSNQWKDFIIAANTFALTQKQEAAYPTQGNHCLLCNQPLSADAVELINKYWAFIKSEAEKKAASALTQVQQTQAAFEKLDFNIFPEGNLLTEWMGEKKATDLTDLKFQLQQLKVLSGSLIDDMKNKSKAERTTLRVDINVFDNINADIDEQMKGFADETQQNELQRLLKVKTMFRHREKLQQHINAIEKYLEQQVWIKKASKASSVWGKRGITEAEKELSGKYFNQKYIDTFNEECLLLDGNFDIQVTHTGTAGASYRQLTLKGKTPSAVLSEGEQKVIAIADFIAEMRMSSINKGMIYDDPVTSLDEHRKKRIAEHLAELSKKAQIIVFSHDLVFVSALITYCQDAKIEFASHWIEKREDQAGMVFLNNSPSYEKEYRSNVMPMKYYADAKKEDCPPAQRESLISDGFTALRTCYEVLVINDLFKNVVQRFNERVSIDSLKEVALSQELIDEIGVNFGLCCRYMKGHTHSDAYAYQKPELKNLKEEIDRYDDIKKKIKDGRKQKGN